MSIRVGILGYGNLGRGVECAIRQNPDMELKAVFTRRAPETVKILTEGVPVYHVDEAEAKKDEIDVLILCGGSATDLPVQTPKYAQWFNVVDSFDTHAKIPEHFAAVDESAQKSGKVGIISVGWDPGMFSLNRLYAAACLPEGENYTFWGKGVSQGHSDAIRRIEGVKDARQYTIPVESALEAVRSRKEKCKLEIVGNDIYQVIARYLEMNGKPYVMELVHRLDEDALTDLEEKQYLIEQLTGYNEKLYQDVLTGVFNRRYYEEKVKNMWGPVGIAMMDLDNFKYYNDSYGHNVGDLALNSAAKVILSNIRKSDFLIRYGGDEFLLVLPGIRKDAFDKKLNQIQKQLHQTTLDGYPGISLSVSIGGVTTVEETVGTALERADRLMYQAKKHRNQVVTESSTEGIRQEVGERLERDSGRELVLIVDDAKINREILFEMLKDRFDIIEASSGEECLELLHQYGTEISIVLLDFIMSGMDGLGVLKVMNKEHLIEDIPVIMISSEDSELHIRQAYEMGVSDYISRPFDTNVVRQRVYNTIKLYAKQRKLIDLVAGQMQEKEKNNQIMVNILSHIVECRNGESGQHVRNIGILTKILLKKLMQKTDRYQMTWGDLNRIALASALHDIGKIGIEEAILNKPEKLTQEEYEKMKKHTVIGWSMLQNLKQYQEEPLVRIAEQICRWHHERYDGKGYPDGLKGDEIPISAQVVSLADVYDALTNERVYKKAIPHEKAIEMIVTGECGQFNPLLIECLLEIKEDIPIQLMNAEHRNSWTPLGGG